MTIDISNLPALGAAFLLVFARTGTMVMLLPGLGEQNISARLRLTIAMMLAAVLLPLHRNDYHIDPGALAPAIVMLIEEIIIGAVLGLTARLTISALEVAGSVIAQQLVMCAAIRRKFECNASAMNGSATRRARKIARIFGTKTSVDSWICVSA